MRTEQTSVTGSYQSMPMENTLESGGSTADRYRFSLAAKVGLTVIGFGVLAMIGAAVVMSSNQNICKTEYCIEQLTGLCKCISQEMLANITRIGCSLCGGDVP
jgi:hypothetical protein